MSDGYYPTDKDGLCEVASVWEEPTPLTSSGQQAPIFVASGRTLHQQNVAVKGSHTRPLCTDLRLNQERASGGVDEPIYISEDDEPVDVMRNVSALKQAYLDKTTGLPAQRFTVVNCSDKILYTFLLQAQKSSVPNAGNGLFLRFLGAQEMKPTKWKRRIEIGNLRQIVSDPYNQLQACHPDGFGIHVDVAGDHIKSWYNALYRLQKLVALLPQRSCDQGKRRCKVTFSDQDLPYNDDKLRGLRKPDNHIGHFKLCTIDDYVDAPMRKFSSLYPDCGFVDSGRYGPFL